MYKDRNQLLFFLFLFPNLQENYLSNVVCTVMDAALSCIESFMEAREQERQQLKKRKRKFESCMICEEFCLRRLQFSAGPIML